MEIYPPYYFEFLEAKHAIQILIKEIERKGTTRIDIFQYNEIMKKLLCAKQDLENLELCFAEIR